MMEDLLGDDYTMDEIREAIGAQHYGEEVHVVQSLVGQSSIPETSHGNVDSPLKIDPPVIEGERTITFVTSQQRGEESHNMGPSSLPILSSVWKINYKCIQVEESGITSLEGNYLPN